MACVAQAGPVFDDYLNYVRPGVSTGPGPAMAICLAGHPIGQTFTLPPKVGEIYRIGIRPAYETWTTGERVTMTLFDSPRRKIKLGEYAIDQATSHVQAAYVEKAKATDHVLYFQFRAPIAGKNTFYFEIEVNGGDGAVAFQGFNKEHLAYGQAFPEKSPIKDLSFECHVKPIADLQANLMTFFSDRLDLSRSDLEVVKAAVEAKDWDRAIAETVKHFDGRGDVWDRWHAYNLNPRKDADTRLPDLLMKNMLLHGETNQPVAWRPESYWAPEYPTDRKQEAKAVTPSTYTWHFDRTLGRAYFDTRKDAYARTSIDLRMQFILDNPSPKTSGLPWCFELWNDRTAAARAPGYGTWAYAYFQKFAGFSNDQKLIFISFLEDNAAWVYKSESGANWGAEAARACYEFGVMFPEWKASKAYVDWGTHRLAEIVLEDVRGDGTSTEAAIKYHAMVARRLKGMLEDHFEHRVTLEPLLLEKLLKCTERMYEVMAYTLQPNDSVVMCGDSWNENYAYSGDVQRESVPDPARLIARLRDAKDPLSAWLTSQLSDDVREKIKAYQGNAKPADALLQALLGGLAKIINPPRDEKTDARGDPIFTPERFKGVTLSPLSKRLIEIKPPGVEIEHLNRVLLSDAYAPLIVPAWKSGELHSAGEMVKRPDFTWIASQGRAGAPPRETSKVFPDGGYFIMRSDCGEPSSPTAAFGKAANPNYLDSRQLFIHNGGWFGSHGHADLLSLNLYAFGRTLIVDPGQYDYTPPPGIGNYWSSNIHSMLVMDGRDVAREPGPSEWTSNPLIDYFDGKHHGYKRITVRRRVAFIKPDYFVIDDTAERMESAPSGQTDAKSARDWAQVWDLTDPQARIDDKTKTITTTFPAGGNLLILNREPDQITAETAPGLRAVAGSKNHAPTRIVRLHQKNDLPHFTTLLVPFDGVSAPDVTWTKKQAEEGTDYSLTVSTPWGADWMALGTAGRITKFADGSIVNADFAAVAHDGSFSWSDGKRLSHGKELAHALQRVHSLSVRKSGDLIQIEASESEPTLAIAWDPVRDDKSRQAGSLPPKIVLNGRPVEKPVVRDGMYYPFADQPVTIVADDRDAFTGVAIGKRNEWARVTDPRSWQVGYMQHETDVGGHETGKFTLNVDAPHRYSLEVFIPQVSLRPSDRVEYHVPAKGTPFPVKDAVKSVRHTGQEFIITLDQQAASGWVRLGDFDVPSGKLVVTLVNMTGTDGLYLIADAVRLVAK